MTAETLDVAFDAIEIDITNNGDAGTSGKLVFKRDGAIQIALSFKDLKPGNTESLRLDAKGNVPIRLVT